MIVDGLERAGTPRIFLASAAGPGRELADAARRHGLPIVTVSGGEVACLMARVTGELSSAAGAAVVSLGPDIATEAASARTTRAPLILLTDDSARDAGDLAAGVVKRSVRLEPDSAADAFADALVLAMTEPRGPVHVQVPADVLAREASRIIGSCRPGPLPAADPGAFDAAARRLVGATRPILVAGRRARGREATTWLRALAEALPAPVLATPAAKGAMPDPHPLAFGVVGNPIGTALAGRGDLLVAIGVDADEIAPSWWPAAPVLDLEGEIASALEELAPRLRGRARADWDVAELDRLKRRLAALLGSGAPFGPARVVELAREATAAGTIVAAEAGFRAAALERWHAVAPLEVLTPPDPARRGFALPAALAAALGHADRKVLCLAEAATIARQPTELELAARLALPVVVVAGGPAADDVVAHAGALSILTLGADTPDAFRVALGRALAGARPVLIAVATAPGPV